MTLRTYLFLTVFVLCAPQFNCSIRYPQGGNGGASGDVPSSAGTAGDDQANTAGAPKKDWTSVCIIAESKNPVNRNMAAQSGMTIKSLAAGICSQKSVVECYSKGHCK
jgi:hypothetical protein